MKALLCAITDKVTTKRGMWITLAIWIVGMILLSAGPPANEYKVTNFQSLPNDAQSIVANQKLNEFFSEDQGTPAIIVFHNEAGAADLDQVGSVLNHLAEAEIPGVQELVAFSKLPTQAQASFISEDQSTVVIPANLDPSLSNADIKETVDRMSEVGDEAAGEMMFRITGPAGIAGDTLKLFERADLVLLLSTVVLILILLIVIYRSPLLALIPLFATAIVYQVVNQVLGLIGMAGLEISNSTLSIMSILLFAAVIDYSLFVFSRYRDELSKHVSKFDAMKYAMRSIGEPVFFSGGTVLAAMIVLFLANFRDYRNFAPVFGTTMLIIMFGTVTLVPALFTLFGRKSFWPKVPEFGETKKDKKTVWQRTAQFVTQKPGLVGGTVALLLILSALNVFNLNYEFDTVKAFPKDMPSREGYELVESKFDKGDIAPTTVVFEGKAALSEAEIESLRAELAGQAHIASARIAAATEDSKIVKFSLSFDINPYSVEALDTIVSLREHSELMMKYAGIDGDLYFAGVTAFQADERAINNRDLIVIIVAETALILLMLLILTRSIRMPLYMMGTILLSYLAALGLGIFLVDVLFGYDSLSTRVPVYAFVFLVALGIDYNIMLVSRYKEERIKHPVRKAVENALAHTGGVISSAGLILAATFAVLMTQPISVLFVFGFIVAIGILLDTFLVRGLLMPALMIFFERDDKTYDLKNKNMGASLQDSEHTSIQGDV